MKKDEKTMLSLRLEKVKKLISDAGAQAGIQPCELLEIEGCSVFEVYPKSERDLLAFYLRSNSYLYGVQVDPSISEKELVALLADSLRQFSKNLASASETA